VSHFCWRDDRHVLAYASTAAAGDRYHLFEDESERFATIGDDFFRADGHPQFSPNGAWLLTDSYPDRSRLQSLFVYDMDRQSGTTLARLKIPLRYRYDVRCDFHPRWSRDGRWICFDSAHTGRRALCTLEWTGLDHQPSS
jgi:Tol biopolymer transport system component